MKTQSGNVLLYVMIAILLFEALSFAMMRSGGSDAGIGGRVSDDRAAIKAQELIGYATSARTTIEQMSTMSNVLPGEFDFVKPGAAGYDTGGNLAKVFHPGGGGLSAFVDSPELYANGVSGRGWVSQQGTNVQWTPTAASDIIFSFVDVDAKICAAINQKLFRDSTIPSMSESSNAVFVNGGGDDANFTSGACGDCVGKPAACVQDSDGAYAFYTVVLGR